MRLAAHLCGSRVDEVLHGDDRFLSELSSLGFQRVQINATSINGVDTSNLGHCVPKFLSVMKKFPNLEFILQKCEESRPLWEGVLKHYVTAASSSGNNCEDGGSRLPSNITMLLDESKGEGLESKDYPAPPDEYDIGYAGGIGPKNISDVLDKVCKAGRGRSIWIDMESGIRSTRNGEDIFDLDKCYQCIKAVCLAKLHHHPSFLA